MYIIRSWKNIFLTIPLIFFLHIYINVDELIRIGGMRALEYANSTSGIDIERSNESFVVNLISKSGISTTLLFYSIFFIIINTQLKNKVFFPIKIFITSSLIISLFSNEPFVNLSVFSILFWIVFSLSIRNKNILSI